jgi:hypothetical protein
VSFLYGHESGKNHSCIPGLSDTTALPDADTRLLGNHRQKSHRCIATCSAEWNQHRIDPKKRREHFNEIWQFS